MDFKLTFVQFLHKNLGNYEVKNYSQVELESQAYLPNIALAFTIIHTGANGKIVRGKRLLPLLVQTILLNIVYQM